MVDHRYVTLAFLDRLADQALSEGLIDGQEAELMKRTEAGRLRTINGDDFAPEKLVAATAVKKPVKKTTTKAKAKKAA